MNPVWKIGKALTVEDNSTNRYEPVEIRPTAQETGNLKHTIVGQDLESWYRWSEAQLECHFTIGKDGGNLVSADGVILPNGFGIFDNMKLVMSNAQIADASNPGDLHMLQQLPKYSEDYAGSVGSNSMFYPLSTGPTGDLFEYNGGAGLGNLADHPDYDASITGLSPGGDQNLWVNYNSLTEPIQKEITVNITATSVAATGRVRKNPFYNKNASLSRDRMTGGQTCRMMLPLKELFPVLGQCFDRAVRGVRFELSAERKNDSDLNSAFIINTTEANDVTLANLNITRLSLWVPQMVPSSDTLGAVQTLLLNTPSINCQYEHNHLYEEPKAVLGLSERISLSTESAKVLRIYVAFKYNDRLTNGALYPYDYNGLNVDRLHARVNGTMIPSEEYQVTAHPPRILHDVHAITGKKGDHDNGSMIDYDSWYTGAKRIYCIDLTHQSDSIFKNRNVSSVELNYTFSSLPSAAYTVFAVVTTERQLAIDILNQKMNVTVK